MRISPRIHTRIIHARTYRWSDNKTISRGALSRAPAAAPISVGSRNTRVYVYTRTRLYIYIYTRADAGEEKLLARDVVCPGVAPGRCASPPPSSRSRPPFALRLSGFSSLLSLPSLALSRSKRGPV